MIERSSFARLRSPDSGFLLRLAVLSLMAIQAVPGVGDDAFWAGYPLNTLYVLQDTTYLDIGYVDFGGEGRLEQVRPLALTALRRLR